MKEGRSKSPRDEFVFCRLRAYYLAQNCCVLPEPLSLCQRTCNVCYLGGDIPDVAVWKGCEPPKSEANAVIRMRASGDMRQGRAVRVTGAVAAPFAGWESAAFISGPVLLKLFI
jgi:hypothetical protein